MQTIEIQFKAATYYGLTYTIYSNGKIFGPERGEISQRMNPDGYMDVTLGSLSNRHARVKVHRIIAEQFVPNPNNLPEVNHIDYNRSNNDVSNLEWVSHKDNISYSSEAGHYKVHDGERNGRANMSWDEVGKIRSAYESGCKISDIVLAYKIPYSTIFNIVHNKTWVR